MPGIEIDKTKGQLFGQLIKIKFVSPTQYELSVDFDEATTMSLMHYSDLSVSEYNVREKQFKKVFKINESVELPFLNLKLLIKPKIQT